MRTWKHNTDGRTVQMADHQIMTTNWTLVEEAPQPEPVEEVTLGDKVETPTATFASYKELLRNADKSAVARVGDKDYSYNGKNWKRVTDDE